MFQGLQGCRPVLAALLLGLTVTGAASASGGLLNNQCGQGCGPGHCPCPFDHYSEGHPRLRFKCACPKPICPPCDAPNWGYHQPCWRPWPWSPDWSHCPVQVPAGMLPHGPPYEPEIPGPYGIPRQELNAPRRLEGNGGL